MRGPRARGRRGSYAGTLAAGVAVLALAACGGGGYTSGTQRSSATSSVASSAASSGSSGPSAGGSAPPSGSSTASTGTSRPTKLLVVVLENHAPDSVEREMPWLSAQGRQYGSATQYYAMTHPSLPNYLAIAGGSTFGITDDRGPDSHQLDGPSVFGQGPPGAARTYAEGMSEPCEQHNDGRYAVRHNPWAYFPAERPACLHDDVPAGTPSGGALQSDLAAGRMPTFSLLVPDVCNDAHDCDLSTADQWLQSWDKVIQAGADWKAGRLAVLVTFDEDDHSAGNHITAVVMHPSLHGVRVDQRLDHRDLSASASHILGGPPLREAAGRTGVLAAFGLA